MRACFPLYHSKAFVLGITSADLGSAPAGWSAGNQEEDANSTENLAGSSVVPRDLSTGDEYVEIMRCL
jgi:hypothetical protein